MRNDEQLASTVFIDGIQSMGKSQASGPVSRPTDSFLEREENCGGFIPGMVRDETPGETVPKVGDPQVQPWCPARVPRVCLGDHVAWGTMLPRVVGQLCHEQVRRVGPQ